MFQRTPNRVHVSAGTRVPPHLRKSTKPKLESTIHVVAHGSHIDAISIDGKSPLACSLWKCRDSDREHYVSKYRTQFYSRINCNDEATVQELERMMAQWQLKGCLYLSHDKPQLPCHAAVISEYLCFELRRRGLAGDQYA